MPPMSPPEGFKVNWRCGRQRKSARDSHARNLPISGHQSVATKDQHGGYANEARVRKKNRGATMTGNAGAGHRPHGRFPLRLLPKDRCPHPAISFVGAPFGILPFGYVLCQPSRIFYSQLKTSRTRCRFLLQRLTFACDGSKKPPTSFFDRANNTTNKPLVSVQLWPNRLLSPASSARKNSFRASSELSK